MITPPRRSRRIFVSAGEVSGDHHAARVVDELLASDPNLTIDAFGGAALERAGARILFPLPDLAVMGFRRVFENFGRFVGVIRQYVRYLDEERPDAVILADYPGLHIRFAALARRRGIRVIYFVCPQLWAWAPWRAKRFQRAVDHALTILPFEEEYFRRRGIEAAYIGHPAADGLAAAVATSAHDELTARVRGDDEGGIALLPGSRPQEVAANLPWMLRVAEQILREIPSTRFFLPQARDDTRRACRELLASSPVPVELVEEVYPVLRGARFALVCSGTATFEVAWHGVPMVVLYKITPLQRLLGGTLLTVPWISQVNLIAGEELVPEFVSGDEQIEEVTAASLDHIRNTETRRRCLHLLSNSLRYAFEPGASKRAADVILNLLSRDP